MSIASVMPSNHLLLCCPLLSCPQSFFPSIGVFSNESALHIRRPKYWSFSFSISPSNEYSGLISFWMDWLDLLAVQGTLKNLLQHHSLKASILQRSAIFMVQLSHPYMTTGKTIALSTGTFVGKRMSPFFNTQSCFGALGICKAFSEGWSCLVGYSQTVGVVSTARSSDGGPQKIHSLLDWWPLHWVEGARDLSLRTYSIILSCV